MIVVKSKGGNRLEVGIKSGEKCGKWRNSG